MSKSIQLRGLCYLQQKGYWVINFVQTDFTCRRRAYRLGSLGQPWLITTIKILSAANFYCWLHTCEASFQALL